MKNHFYIYLSFFITLISIQNGQAQTWEWIQSIGGAETDISSNLVLDDSSNVYVAGYFRDTVTINGTNYISQAQEDGLILKFDSLGNVLMVKQIMGTGSVKPRKIRLGPSNNILVFSTFDGTVTFGASTINSTGTNTNFFLGKYDNTGNPLWNRRVTPNFDYDIVAFKGVGLDTDNAGNIYIGGHCMNNVTIGTTNITTNGEKGYLAKLSSNGAVLWTRTPGSTGSFTPRIFLTDLSVDSSGTFVYVVTYQYNGLCIGCPTGGIQDLSVNLYKYGTASGSFNPSFSSSANVAPLNTGELSAVIKATDDAVYIGGEFISGITFGNTSLGNTSGSSSNTRDAFLTKFNTINNTWEWATVVGGPSGQDIKDITVSSEDNVYITGSYENSISLGNISLQANGQSAFLAEFDENGTFQFAKKAGSGAGDSGNGIDVNDDGDVFISGDFFAQGIFDNDTVTSLGSSDIFIAKLACVPAPIEGISGDTVSCIETKNYAIVNAPGPAVSYTWSLSGGGTLIPNGDVASVSWTNTGIHTITAIPTNECGQGAVFTLQVRVLDIPQQPNINGDPNACIGSATYNVVNVFGENYAWSLTGGGNLFPLGNTAIVNWAVTGSHTLSVTPSNICGIGQIAQLPITLRQIPSQPAPITGNTTICLSTQTYSIPSEPDVNYNWSLSSGGTITAIGNTATINWTTPGTHTLTVTPDNICGLGSSRSTTIIVNDVPSQPSTPVGNLITCIGTENYSIINTPNTNYNWTLSGGGIISSLGASATVTWATPGTYTLTITPSNICGNGTPRVVTMQVEDIPSQPSAILGLDTVCLGSQVYTIPQQQGVNYTWSLSGGGSIIPATNTATINWTSAGTHTVTVTPNNNCGTGASRSMVVFVKNVNPQVTAISGADTVCQGVSVYSVPNVSGLNYSWSLSGGGTLTAVNNNAFIDWTNTGLYTINVATSDGCSNSLTVDARDLPNQPSVITGDATVCLGTSNYSITPENDVDYIWTLSGGGVLTQSNFVASVNWTTTGTHTLSVIPSNLCGNGTARMLTIQVNTIPNAISNITGDTLVCLGNATYNAPVNANVNYNWSLSNSGAVISTTSNTANINWLTTGTNQLSVTASNLCGTSPISDLDIIILDIPTTPAISGDTSVCLGNEVYTVNQEDFTNYNWTLGSGGTLNISNDTANINWTNIGIHQLTVTPSNQCGTGNATSIFVNAQDIPTQPAALLGDSVVCQGVKSYSVPNISGVNYTWSLSGGGSIVVVGNTATINWTTAGTYTLTATPSNICGTGLPISKTIQVIGIPNQPTPIVGNAITCLSTTTYSVTNDPSATYSWSLSGGGVLIQNGNSATINWTTAGIYTLTVAPSSLCGTGTVRSLLITVNDLPATPQLNVGDTAVCLGSQLYSINPISGVSYAWSLSGGGTLNASGPSATVNWTNKGNHIVTVTPTNTCGTGNILSIPVAVNSIPNQIANISGDTSLCLETATYTINAVSGETYNWSISGGGNLSAFEDSATVNWFNPGTHSISIIPSNTCGIGASTALTVQVNDVPSQPNSIEGDATVCENEIVFYHVNALNNVNYSWSLNSGGTIINTNNDTVEINWTTAGIYTLTVTPDNDCGSGAAQTLTIEVIENNLSTSPIEGDTLVCNGEELFYSVDFQNDISYEWLLSDKGNLNPINSSTLVKWEEAGMATLQVVPSGICGVGDTTSLNITIENPLPTPVITQSGDSLIANISEGLTWLVNDEVIPITNNFIIPQVEGIYTITAENICGTTETSQPVVVGGSISGMYVYPNPARNRVTMHYPIYLRWYFFDVIDYSGRLVIGQTDYNGTNEIEINIRKLDSGIYLVRSYTELGYFYTKMVVAN